MEVNISIIRKNRVINLIFFIFSVEKIETKLIKMGFATGDGFFKTQIPQASSQNPFEDTGRNRYLVKQKNLVYYAITNIENLGNSKIKFYCDDDNK